MTELVGVPLGELVVGLFICLGFGMLAGLFRRSSNMGRG